MELRLVGVEPSQSRFGKRGSTSKNTQTKQLSLTEVANVVDGNANYLIERFKEVTGMNFVEYVARTRFANACDLLRNSNVRISDIAFAAGLQSLSQFNRVFKRFSGKSPTHFRSVVGVVDSNQ